MSKKVRIVRYVIIMSKKVRIVRYVIIMSKKKSEL